MGAFTKHFFPEIENLKAQGKEFVCAQIIDTLPETKYWVRNPDLGKRGFGCPCRVSAVTAFSLISFASYKMGRF